jgi:hypothetical protein
MPPRSPYLCFALSVTTAVPASLCLWQDVDLLENKGGETPGLCQLLSNWGKVASEQLKPVITGEMMKKVRYQNRPACAVRYRYRPIPFAISEPRCVCLRYRYRATLAISISPSLCVSVRLCAVQMKAERKQSAKEKTAKVKQEGGSSKAEDEESGEEADEAVDEEVEEATPTKRSSKRKRGEKAVRY